MNELTWRGSDLVKDYEDKVEGSESGNLCRSPGFTTARGSPSHPEPPSVAVLSAGLQKLFIIFPK